MPNKKLRKLSHDSNLEFALSLKRFHNCFAGDDDLREAMMFTLYFKDMALATDGHLLAIRKFRNHLTKSDSVKLFKNCSSLHKDLILEDDIVDKILDQYGVELTSNEKYPDYQKVIDFMDSRDEFVSFRTDVLFRAVEYCRKEGFQNITTSFNNAKNRNFLLAQKDYSEEFVFILVMPIIASDNIEDFIKNIRFKNNTCSIDFVNTFIKKTSGMDLKYA